MLLREREIRAELLKSTPFICEDVLPPECLAQTPSTPPLTAPGSYGLKNGRHNEGRNTPYQDISCVPVHREHCVHAQGHVVCTQKLLRSEVVANPTQSLEDRPTSDVEYGLGDVPQAGRMEDIYFEKDW
jgi:hypothetical protein